MTNDKSVEIWLNCVCFMIFVMAVIGAVTRLTESGLSIVEWRPVTGALPPLNEHEWQRLYDLYRQSPEFESRHYWMALSDFKKIFFWEWIHRLWGRLIGLVYAVPFLWFALRKKIPAGYTAPLAALFLLGGAQGALGWWMVKSGLADRPDVSHYRLAAHLALALCLFAACRWTALTLRPAAPAAAPVSPGMRAHGWGALAMLAITIVWGAFTAGLDAGKIYNSWPLMGGSFLPPENFTPAAFLDGQAWVQFAHRWLAALTGIAVLAFAARTKSPALAAMVIVQIGLGITTLLSGIVIPLAALHQAGAIILLTLMLDALYRARPTPPR